MKEYIWNTNIFQTVTYVAQIKYLQNNFSLEEIYSAQCMLNTLWYIDAFDKFRDSKAAMIGPV